MDQGRRLVFPTGAADAITRRLKPHTLVRVFVPSRDRRGFPLTSPAELGRIVEVGLSDISVGATSLRGEGIYQNGGSEAVREPVIVVEAYMPSGITGAHRRAFLELLDDVARRADQEALAVVVGERLILVKAEARDEVSIGAARE